MTMIWSKPRIVSKRCAMTTIVDLGKEDSIVFWTSSCVAGSRAEVASSRRISEGWRTTMRARHKSWRCPKLKLPPSAFRGVQMPYSMCLQVSSICTIAKPLQSSSSVCSQKGSRFSRTDVCNKTGSCGTRPTEARRVWRPMCVVSTPLIMMRPSRGSMMRNMLRRSVDFPQPVVPTMPALEHGSTMMLTSFSTSRGMSPYPARRSSMTTSAPWLSQPLMTSMRTSAGVSVQRMVAIILMFLRTPLTATMRCHGAESCRSRTPTAALSSTKSRTPATSSPRFLLSGAMKVWVPGSCSRITSWTPSFSRRILSKLCSSRLMSLPNVFCTTFAQKPLNLESPASSLGFSWGSRVYSYKRFSEMNWNCAAAAEPM
mmetsp:Transcript_64842/g.200812  ORF Transcript_64842/g.200812 Transcript_64842/m.200812 type:complete len:371 (-) Transcript_64842:2601-3713(-)